MRLPGQALVCLAVIVVAGCNKGPGVALYPVTGTVTYEGKPVEGATVTYLSKHLDDPASSGVTDSEGRFSLRTYLSPSKVLKGAPSGDYRVTIVKEESKGAAPQENVEALSDQERAQKALSMMNQHMVQGGNPNQAKAPPKPKSEIPIKYASPDTSGFQATVLAEQNDPVEYKLTDD